MIVLRHHTLAFFLELFLLIRVKTTFTVVKYPIRVSIYVVYMSQLQGK